MFNVLKFDSLESTNKYGKEKLKELNDFDVIYTTNQLNGKGRKDRKWLSNKDSLTFSVVLKSPYCINNFDSLSLLAASSVFISLKKHLKKGLSIKWPNDIYYYDSKICGILLESFSYGENIEGIILGVGLNVNNDLNDFKDISNSMDSLFNITGEKYNLDEILNDILETFYMLYQNALNNKFEYLKIIKKNNYLKNKRVNAIINGVITEVKVLDVLKNNKLLVKLNNNEKQELYTDEVELLKQV